MLELSKYFRKTFYRPFASTGILALSLMALSSLTPVQAGEQADRAIQQVKSLIADGKIQKGSSLKLVVKQGNIANFLGKDHALRLRWERETGISIDINTMPQIASLDFVRDYDNVDLTIVRNREYPDLDRQDLVEDLTPYREKFGFQVDADVYLNEYQARYAGKQIAIPADGDIALLYIRKDLIEDAENKAQYFARFGVELKIPDTWEEYLRQVEFFHNPEENLYGSLEQRDQASGWMFWMLRYLAQNQKTQLLFDEDMNPLIDGPEGIAATQNYIDTAKFSPEGILDSKSNYTFTLPRFLNGQGYSTIITLAGAKTFNLPHSKVKDKYVVIPMPGIRFGNDINRRTTLIFGNNLVIPKNAQNKDLAYLYAMWITDKDISVEAVSTKKGFADPYRYSHLSSPPMQDIYSADVLNVLRDQLDYTVSAGTGLPGDTEYIAVLNKQIYLAAKGDKSAEEAMRDAASAWQEITIRLGRGMQKEIWAEVRRTFPK